MTPLQQEIFAKFNFATHSFTIANFAEFNFVLELIFKFQSTRFKKKGGMFF